MFYTEMRGTCSFGYSCGYAGEQNARKLGRKIVPPYPAKQAERFAWFF